MNRIASLNISSANSADPIRARRSRMPVDDLFLQRWSPRAFDGEPLPKRALMTMLEAARWAPSAYNVQPWRFVYTLRDDAHWADFLALLDPFNADWAQHAGALVFVLSDTLRPGVSPATPFPSHSFDTGAAWAQFALQATLLGYASHAMGGIYHQRVREVLNVPAHYRVEIGIAVGRVGSTENLSPTLQAREQPSQRLPLEALAFAGKFDAIAAASGEGA